ncbi:MAG: hypothetical protein UHD09_06505 [Bifidobacterium sp.]|nr:hypothetical protein [Bifidobacterium sp.]
MSKEREGEIEDDQPIDDADADMASGDDRFDPSTCCDPLEQVMIAAMRHVLRPEQAPECLYEKLRMTLDKCCDQPRRATVVTHTTIITYRKGK